MRLALLSLFLVASTVAGFICPVSKSPMLSSFALLATSGKPDPPSTKTTNPPLVVEQEVSRRVALVMAAAVAATGGNLPAAQAVALSTKVESIEFENMATVNSNGAPEKHLPEVSILDDTSEAEVKVVVPHVMDPEKPHYIEYIWLSDVTTKKVLAVKKFDATDASPPTLTATIDKGSKIKALLYCNLHGLWQGETLSV